MQQVKKWLDEKAWRNAVGQCRLWLPRWNQSRRTSVNPALGGGACTTSAFTQRPSHRLCWDHTRRASRVWQTSARRESTSKTPLLGYDNGAMALLSSAIRTSTPHEATIVGTEGTIHIPTLSGGGQGLAQSRRSRRRSRIRRAGSGYNYEAAEVGRCLREGLERRPTMSLDETIALMNILDAVRAVGPYLSME